MKKFNRFAFAVYTSLSAALLVGCGGGGGGFSEPVNEVVVSPGSGDFSKFVAIGDSLTAGFADGTLYRSGQQSSLPSILAQQFALVGGGDFTQPLINDNVGGLLLAGNLIPDFIPRLILELNSLGERAVTVLAQTPTTEVSNILTGPFNNMGVPGAKSYHLGLTTYGDITGIAGATANPYFVRFASSSMASMIGDAAIQAPSYFMLWIGANDILAYATSGGDGVDRTGDTNVAGYGSDDITDPTVFASVYSSLVSAFGATPGIVLNIPDVSAIPFFNTIPFNPLPLDAPTALAADAAYDAYNAGLQTALGANLIDANEAALRTITFTAGANAAVITDEDLTDLSGLGLPPIRQTTANDFILLPSRTIIGTEATPGDPRTVFGIGTPLDDESVLTMTEALLVESARQSYNSTIEAVANANPNVQFFDVATLLDTLNETGINYGTGIVTSTFGTGNAFSLDGVHPTARGYAVIANQVIDAIEAQFGATIPGVDPSDYSTVFFE